MANVTKTKYDCNIYVTKHVQIQQKVENKKSIYKPIKKIKNGKTLKNNKEVFYENKTIKNKRQHKNLSIQLVHKHRYCKTK